MSLSILATEGVCGGKEWFARRGFAQEDKEAGRKVIREGGEIGIFAKQSQQVLCLQQLFRFIRFIFATSRYSWDATLIIP
ncbi:MAG: hypothetical protein A3J28_06065 [Acidobacteria bacterium RIFCSPLOWO2_12_FULL_60_22]|nr:MAG: hypothetical protein A3J28_06065 [Acidobacteria bacterium RIFCSPLOWO2_12_FULL_60_22]